MWVSKPTTLIYYNYWIACLLHTSRLGGKKIHDPQVFVMWSLYELFRCFIPAYQAELAPEAIRRIFKNCGIYPYDRNVPKLKNIGSSIVFGKCKYILMSYW